MSAHCRGCGREVSGPHDCPGPFASQPASPVCAGCCLPTLRCQCVTRPADPCRHSFTFLRSVQEELRGPGLNAYTRTDYFYCTSCLEERTKTVTENAYRPPAWWNP